MKNNLVRKGLAVGIISLFIGTVSIPTFSGIFPHDDTTPPETTITFDPPEPNGDNGWYTCDVWVTLNATDNESGVNATYYQIDDGVWQTYTGPFPLFNDGKHQIVYHSIDNAGNIEPEQSVEINIDQTAPMVNLAIPRILRFDFYIANCNDETSGMDRVEFHVNGILYAIDDEEPFELLIRPFPSIDLICVDAVAFDAAGNHNTDGIRLPLNYHWAQGLILNPEFTPSTVTFFALFVLANPYGLVMFKQVTFTYNESYYGYIGRFSIRAIFI